MLRRAQAQAHPSLSIPISDYSCCCCCLFLPFLFARRSKRRLPRPSNPSRAQGTKPNPINPPLPSSIDRSIRRPASLGLGDSALAADISQNNIVEMADEEKGADSHSSAGNDWELVSLTASTYAAAPGPILPPLETDKRGVGYFDPKYDSPAAMFMSGHFSLPMEGHVDLLKQSDCKGGTDEVCDKEFSPAMMGDDPHDLNRSYAKAKSCESKLDDDLPSFNLLDNQKSVSLDDVVFGDGKGLGGLSLAGEEERNMFCSSGFDTPDAGSDIFRSAHRDANAATSGIVDPACATGDDPVDSVVGSGVAYIAKGQSKTPCEAWWKKTFSFLCNNAKESVTFRFIFVAATIVGLAILGQHWQREKFQRQQFRLQFNVNSEKMSCSVDGPLGQVKGSRVLSPRARGMYDALGS